jgi:putative ABC transport system substrate-binding protein
MHRRTFLQSLTLAAVVVGPDAAAPGLLRAQPRVPRIGWLSPTSAGANPSLSNAFHEGLREHGWVDGQNVAIEYRWAEAKLERLPELASQLVRLDVALIVTSGDAGVRAARQATETIPIVMAVSGDPVGSGYVTSLARPGGNITGLSYLSPDLSAKLLELSKALVPTISRVAVLWNAANPVKALDYRKAQSAARRLGLTLQSVEVRAPGDFDQAFTAISRARSDMLVTLVDEFINHPSNVERIAEYATMNRLPSVYGSRLHVEAGGLMSYGPSLVAMFKRSAAYVDRILKGSKPADLPVEEPATFELVINLKTAKAIGLTISPSILARADQLIQ